MRAALEFRILGPLEVRRDGAPVPLGGPRQRALLALLLCNANRVVSRDRLIEELLADQSRESADRMLAVQISRLRKAIAADSEESRVVSRAPGYVLRVAPGELDQQEFERLTTSGREALERGDPGQAAALLRQADALWQGRPLADLEFEPFARFEVQRLEELRLAAIEERIEAELELGRHNVVCAELDALVSEHPLRERLRGQLMVALYRCDRQAEALATYRAGRTLLVDELALEPSPHLKQLEQAILNHDETLQLEKPARSRDATAASVREDAPRPPSQNASSRPVPVGAPSRRPWLLAAVAGALALVAFTAAQEGSGAPALRAVPNSLAAIDVRTNTVAADVPVGESPGPIAFGQGSLWVANIGDETVSRIDPVRLQTMRTLSLRGPPTGVAATAHAVWVVQSDPGHSSVSVRRIDPAFDTLGQPRALANVEPGGTASIATQGNAVWVAPSSGLLTHFDARTQRIVQQLDPNASPAAIGLGDGAAWVTGGEADDVTRVNSAGLVTPVAVGADPTAIAIGAGGVWVVDSLDDAVVRIDPSTDSVTNTIPVGRSPGAIAIGAGAVWVANGGDGTVSRIDPSRDRVTATIAVGGSPQAITIADGRAWVTVAAPPINPSTQAGGGTLRIETLDDLNSGPGDSLDPALAYSQLPWQVLDATCAKLLNYPDKSGPAGSRLTPEVARSLPARSPDGKTYTFTVRPGFRFSPPSSQPVTAETFKATIERTLNPRMKSPIVSGLGDVVGARAYMSGKASHIAGVVARGDTLTIRLNAPEPDLPSRLAQPFFCAVPPNSPIDPSGVPILPSAGPYYITSYAPGQAVVLSRNPNYRGSRPHWLDRITIALGISSERAASDIEAGRADYTLIGGFPAATITALASRLAARYGARSPAAAAGRQQYFVTRLAELDFLVLNTHRPLFSDARLRRAVNYAIDRRALAQLGNGFGQADSPTDLYLPPGVPGSSDTHTYPLTADVAKARALAHGGGRTALLYTCDLAACQELGQIIKNDLAAIDLRVRVKALGPAVFYSRVAAPGAPFDLALGNWLPDYPDPASMLNGMLENPSFYPTFDDPEYLRQSAAADRLTGPRRDLAFGKLALDVERSESPIIAYGNANQQEFFSQRIGCQTHNFYNGVDLAALCIRHVVGARR